MLVRNTSEAETWLETVGYYRLSAYWLPFELPPPPGQTRSKRFAEGTSFDQVIERYVFDRKLRLLLLEAIERVEIHVRSRWTYHLAHAHGAHAHLRASAFRGARVHTELLAKLARSAEKSDETFIAHYRTKYTDPYLPPLWAVTELMTFGELSRWVQITRDLPIKAAVTRDLGLPTVEITDGVLQATPMCATSARTTPDYGTNGWSSASRGSSDGAATWCSTHQRARHSLTTGSTTSWSPCFTSWTVNGRTAPGGCA